MSLKEQTKRLVPQSFRNAIRPEVYLAQRGLQKLRQTAGHKGRLPDFLILGAQKAGTTTLYDLLMQHPRVQGPRTKEIAFFDRHYGWGLDWYKSNFQTEPGTLTGEATPCYLYAQNATDRLIRDMPQTTKFVILLRNPVDRAISHYFHEKRLGYETLSLAEALDAEAQRLADGHDILLGRRYENRSQAQSFSYVDRGRYAAQISRYFEAFAPENFYIETSDRFFREPAQVMAEVFAFLDLAPHVLGSVKRRNVGVYSGKIPDVTHQRLEAIFASENAKLAELLGRDLPW